MDTIKKLGKLLAFPFRAVWYGFWVILAVLGMWIVDIAVMRHPEDNTG